MSRPVIATLLATMMIAIIIGLDASLFRRRPWFWERLAVNIGVVLVFGGFYFRLLGREGTLGASVSGLGCTRAMTTPRLGFFFILGPWNPRR